MVVAVVGVESETESRAILKTERLLQLGDEEMPLAKLGADCPSCLWVAINRVFGAIILLFPISRRLAEEDRPRSDLLA